MSREAADQFLEAIAEPPGLDEFRSALSDSVEALVELGSKKGFRFEADELRASVAALMKRMPSPETLTEQELEGVVGGALMTSSNNLKQLSIALHNYDESSLTTTSFWSGHGY